MVTFSGLVVDVDGMSAVRVLAVAVRILDADQVSVGFQAEVAAES